MRRLLPSTSLRVHHGQVLVPSCLPSWGYRSRHRQQDVWWCTRQKSSSRTKGANIRWHTEEPRPRPTDGINKQVSCCCVTTSLSTLYVAHMCTTLYSALRTREAVWRWHNTNWLWNCARRFVLCLVCLWCAAKETLELSWHQHKNQLKVYSVAVILCLLYSIECTTLYRRHIMAQLYHLLNIKWRDRVPDVEVLRRAHTVSVEALVTVAQLRWAGRVQRMANNRFPKAVFYSDLRQGKRSHGGQKLRFKDVLKRHTKKTGISHDTWEEAAQKVKWRGLLRKATSAVEEQRQQEYYRTHVRLHSAATSNSFQCNNSQRYCRSRAGLIAHTRACLR